MNSKNEGKFALLVLIAFLLLIAFCVFTIAKAEAIKEPEEQNEAVIISDTIFKSGLPSIYFLYECQLVGIDAVAFYGDEPLTAEIIFPYNIDLLEHVILSETFRERRNLSLFVKHKESCTNPIEKNRNSATKHH